MIIIKMDTPLANTTPVDISHSKQSIQEQYNNLEQHITGIKFPSLESNMTNELLKFALTNIPSHIKCLDLSDTDLGSEDLELLQPIFAPYITDKYNTIEIIVDEKLNTALQNLLNFEQLLIQVTEYVEMHPEKIPTTTKPLNPNSIIDAHTAFQFIKIIKSRNFKSADDLIAKLTLALLYSGGIANQYVAIERTDSERLANDYARANAYMALWTHLERTSAMRQQVQLLIKELGLEHDISTRRHGLVKKYSSWWQNQLAELIGAAIVPISLERVTAQKIFTAILGLILRLKYLPREQLADSGTVLQILDQIYYWLDIFFKHHRSNESIKELLNLFKYNKDTLRLLDHVDLIEKCSTAHIACLEINPSINTNDIPATPFEELLLSLYVKSFVALTVSVVNNFKHSSSDEFAISVNNITVDSLRGYLAWDRSLHISNIAHINLLFALFYSGIIVNSQGNNQIDLRKSIDFLTTYAKTNKDNAKFTLCLVYCIVNNNSITGTALINSIHNLLEKYRYLNKIKANAILEAIDIQQARHSPVLFSRLNLSDRQNSLERLSLMSGEPNNNESANTDFSNTPETHKAIKPRCCTIM